MSNTSSASKTTRLTEPKEESQAKARLIQTLLAQFALAVTLGDIPVGSAITRYELPPATDVTLESILALSRNLTAKLQAERSHLLASITGGDTHA